MGHEHRIERSSNELSTLAARRGVRVFPIVLAALAAIALVLAIAPTAAAVKWSGGVVKLSASGSTVRFATGVSPNQAQVGTDYIVLDGVKLRVLPTSGAAQVTVKAWHYESRTWDVTSSAGVSFNLSGLVPDFYKVVVNGTTQKQGKAGFYDFNVAGGVRAVDVTRYNPASGAVPGQVSDTTASGGAKAPAIPAGGGKSLGKTQGAVIIAPIHVILAATALGSGLLLAPPVRKQFGGRKGLSPLWPAVTLAASVLILVVLFQGS